MPDDFRLHREVAIFNALREALKTAHPDIADDDECVSDTASGECNIDAEMRRVLGKIIQFETLADATEVVAKTAAERAKRFEVAADNLRGSLARAMAAGEIQKRIFPEATVSLRNGGAPKPKIVDEDAAIDAGFFTTVKKLDREAAIAAFTAGQDCPFVALSNSPPSLTIRKG